MQKKSILIFSIILLPDKTKPGLSMSDKFILYLLNLMRLQIAAMRRSLKGRRFVLQKTETQIPLPRPLNSPKPLRPTLLILWWFPSPGTLNLMPVLAHHPLNHHSRHPSRPPSRNYPYSPTPSSLRISTFLRALNLMIVLTSYPLNHHSICKPCILNRCSTLP